MKMELMRAGLLLLLFCFADSQFSSGDGLFLQDPESEWRRLEMLIKEETMRAPAPESKLGKSAPNGGTPEAKPVPRYVVVPASEVQKEVFKPDKSSRPLPKSVKDMLLKATTTAKPPSTGGPPARTPNVEILCHLDRIYTRIRRLVFKTRKAYKYLQVGKCPVNQGTKEHYYFLYLLRTDCGFDKESNVNDVTIHNVLHYKPPGPVLREMTFDIPLQCTYPRFFHSFKAGYYPKLQGGTIFKALQPKSSFTLTPQDASGNEITGAKMYTLGQPMYFEAKQPDSTAKSGDQRIYFKKCFITASQESNSNPKHTVIDNHGCMIDGKVNSQSKFLTGASKMTQRFSVGSLIFKDMISSSSSTQQHFMHCEISMGKRAPTQSSKACNYDPVTKKWKELYDDDSVCTCCDSTCYPVQSKASRNIISSHSWKVDLSSKDGYAEVAPKMKSVDANAFSLEDPDMAEHGGFRNYWEPDD